MYNERYKFYGMHQEDFYHNPGGARRPIPHQKDYCHDDYMYLVKVDKDDPTPNYLSYKISAGEGIDIVNNSGVLIISSKGGEYGNYYAGEFITIDNDNRIIGVSGLEDVYLTKEEASGIYAPKGCIDRINAEAAEIIQSAKSAWNPMYDTFTSYSGDWQKAALGNNYYEGPYISIYSGEDERQYISASGLTTQEEFENVSGDLYGLSGYIHNSLHPEVIGISSYVYDMWENCSGIPTKISGQIDNLVSSYNEFSANIEYRVSNLEDKYYDFATKTDFNNLVSSYEQFSADIDERVSTIEEECENFATKDDFSHLVYSYEQFSAGIDNRVSTIEEECENFATKSDLNKKQNTLIFSYDSNNVLTSINGSAINTIYSAGDNITITWNKPIIGKGRYVINAVGVETIPSILSDDKLTTVKSVRNYVTDYVSTNTVETIPSILSDDKLTTVKSVRNYVADYVSANTVETIPSILSDDKLTTVKSVRNYVADYVSANTIFDDTVGGSGNEDDPWSVNVMKGAFLGDWDYPAGVTTAYETINGKQYKVGLIGEQIWMLDNYKFEPDNLSNYVFTPGDNVQNIIRINNNKWDDYTINGAKKIDHVEEYGYLYLYDIIESIIPEGWILPTKEDYLELFNYLGETQSEQNKWSNIYIRNSLNLKYAGDFKPPIDQIKTLGTRNGFGSFEEFWAHDDYTKGTKPDKIAIKINKNESNTGIEIIDKKTSWVNWANTYCALRLIKGTPGNKGLVPTPLQSDTKKFLRGDGKWASVSLDGDYYTKSQTNNLLANKQNTLTFGYSNDKIVSINNSAIAGGEVTGLDSLSSEFKSYSSTRTYNDNDLNYVSAYTEEISSYIHSQEPIWSAGIEYNQGNLINIENRYINVVSGENGVALSADVKSLVNTINQDILNVSSNVKSLSSEFQSYSSQRTLTDTTIQNSANNLSGEIANKLNTNHFDSWSSNFKNYVDNNDQYVSGGVNNLSGEFKSYSSNRTYVDNDLNYVSSYANEVSAYIDENKDKWLKDTTYSAGNLINISEDNYINVVSGENGVALSGDVKNLIQDINGTISNVSSNLNTKIEGLSGEFQAYSADRTLTDTILNNSASSLKSDINKVSSYANDVSAYINTHQAEWSARTLYSAGEGIQFNPKGDYIEIATSGLDFSAGKGIKINEYDTYVEIETSGMIYNEDFAPYSSKVSQDINSVSSYGLGLSAYISGHESIWEKGNNYEISSNNTKLISAWKVEGEDGYTFNISANPDMGGGTTYSAGDWIDSEKLNDKDNPTISISGYKPLFVEDPLYFDVDDEKTTLKIDQQKIGIKEKVTLIANGYRNENDNVITTSGITATIPNAYTGVWNFKFDRPMVVNICINARFMPDTERYEDYYDTVGFKVTESTNPIYFTLHGYAPQHFNASTITTIPEGAEIPFSFYLGDNERESIVTGVEQPCITIQEI